MFVAGLARVISSNTSTVVVGWGVRFSWGVINRILVIIFIARGGYTGEGVIIASYVVVPLSPLLGLGVVKRVIGFSMGIRFSRCVRFSRGIRFSSNSYNQGYLKNNFVDTSTMNLIHISIKLNGVAPLIADPPPLKLHQEAKSNPSVKWP